MTPEDILAWRMTASRFSIRCMVQQQNRNWRFTDSLAVLAASLISSFSYAHYADFFLTHHSAAQDVSDYERMRRLSGSRVLCPADKLQAIR